MTYDVHTPRLMGTSWSLRALGRLAVLLYVVESGASTAFQIGAVQRVVPDDAAATAESLIANASAVQAAIAAGLVAIPIKLTIAVLFYRFFRPVDRSTSLVALLLITVAAGVQATSALLALGALDVLQSPALVAIGSAPQQAITVTLMSLSDRAYDMDLGLFGLWCIAIGALAYRSTFVPRWAGAAMAIAGAGYSVFLYASLADALGRWNLALAVGELAFLAWLGFRGIDDERWRASVEQ